MYLQEFEIDNIKCFGHLELSFPSVKEAFGGWIVLLGGNGTGKSTLLQAMAVALLGPPAANRLLDAQGWVRGEEKYGEIRATIRKCTKDSQISGQPRKKPYETAFWVTGDQVFEDSGQTFSQPQLAQRGQPQTIKGLSVGPYSGKKSAGWFSCGYGPFRRLSGGSQAGDRWTYSSGGEARYATLFSEAAALTNCTEWLTKLYSQSIDTNSQLHAKSQRDLEVVCQIVNSLLPSGVVIDRIDSSQVFFKTLGGVTVPMASLSDGYRSFLALAVDLLRHAQESVDDLAAVVGADEERSHITIDGVVLIDEIDAHLHPIWQRDIGFHLRRAFPNLQFIVTTHSPFVAQAATPDGLFVLKPDPVNGVVEAIQPQRSVAGWRADDILTSPLFGLNNTRDPETAGLIQEHADLVAKRTWSSLDSTSQRRLAELDVALSERLTAPGDDLDQRNRKLEMQAYVSETTKKLKATNG